MTIPFTAAQRQAIETALLVNFGSGPSAYAFEYQHSGIRGFNFGMTPSSFVMEQPLLECVAPMLPQGCVVIFAVCPFSFGKNNDDDNIRGRFERYFRVFDSTEPADELWFPYNALREEHGCDSVVMEQRTTSMLKTWSSEFDLTLTENNPLNTDAVCTRNAKSFETKRTHLVMLCEICERFGLRPHILLPPLAKALRERLPDGLFDIFVTENIKKLPPVPVLDYTIRMDDADFCGPVFLSLDGAVRFTQMIVLQLNL